ncbi:class I SAM-dependent methyltransferase [Rubellicoccus peritrichatus]|uniref:Class I SAM-dependent methyltransferase n=1 Tax=Rubellicoccus peritrichatus TaxID=3080537 RepID=A0AAQ3L7X2_9BACT|nr:class I SAM-dependent methyltransferase [Puniceicoccus sp. CR14]WOO40701.1 class I SAM-dependent methyltransferase [Puniceicoccus sp. CR14]
MDQKITEQYRSKGVENFYKQEGDCYSNPHEFAIKELLEKVLSGMQYSNAKALDLACGSGEATVILKRYGFSQVGGIDPYTYEAYKKRIGRDAERFRFEDIAAGCLAERSYDLIVCSFAMHLIEPSWLPRLCTQLSLIAPRLFIITPHKRPHIRSEWFWELDKEWLENRVRLRSYRSMNLT